MRSNLDLEMGKGGKMEMEEEGGWGAHGGVKNLSLLQRMLVCL